MVVDFNKLMDNVSINNMNEVQIIKVENQNMSNQILC